MLFSVLVPVASQRTLLFVFGSGCGSTILFVEFGLRVDFEWSFPVWILLCANGNFFVVWDRIAVDYNFQFRIRLRFNKNFLAGFGLNSDGIFWFESGCMWIETIYSYSDRVGGSFEFSGSCRVLRRRNKFCCVLIRLRFSGIFFRVCVVLTSNRILIFRSSCDSAEIILLC